MTGDLSVRTETNGVGGDADESAPRLERTRTANAVFLLLLAESALGFANAILAILAIRSSYDCQACDHLRGEFYGTLLLFCIYSVAVLIGAFVGRNRPLAMRVIAAIVGFATVMWTGPGLWLLGVDLAFDKESRAVLGSIGVAAELISLLAMFAIAVALLAGSLVPSIARKFSGVVGEENADLETGVPVEGDNPCYR